MQSIIDLLGLPARGERKVGSASSARRPASSEGTRGDGSARTDDDRRLARRELERGRDGAAARVEGAVGRERRVLVRQDKVAVVVVHDAHVGRRELAIVDVRVEAGGRGRRVSRWVREWKPPAAACDRRRTRRARRRRPGRRRCRQSPGSGEARSTWGPVDPLKALVSAADSSRRWESGEGTHRAAADGQALGPELVLEPRLADDEDLLVLGQVKDLGNVDGRGVGRAEDLLLRERTTTRVRKGGGRGEASVTASVLWLSRQPVRQAILREGGEEGSRMRARKAGGFVDQRGGEGRKAVGGLKGGQGELRTSDAWIPSLSNLALYWTRDLVALLLTKTARRGCASAGRARQRGRLERTNRGPCLLRRGKEAATSAPVERKEPLGEARPAWRRTDRASGSTGASP